MLKELRVMVMSQMPVVRVELGRQTLTQVFSQFHFPIFNRSTRSQRLASVPSASLSLCRLEEYMFCRRSPMVIVRNGSEF